MRYSFPSGAIATAAATAHRLIVQSSGSFGASLYPHTILIPRWMIFDVRVAEQVAGGNPCWSFSFVFISLLVVVSRSSRVPQLPR